MADLDEEPIVPESGPSNATHPSQVADQDASDDEDEQIQDYRFLAATTKKDGHLLPRRGEKDFEPHGTQAQSSTLAASQAAMHDALSIERVHGPVATDTTKSSHLVGVFDASTGLTYVAKEQGVFFRTMGHPVKGGRGGSLLEPEEALWLCERGSMEIQYGAGDSDSNELTGLSPLEGLPMSLQTAYACCIGSRNLTLERYIVYAGLRRAGYSVFRAKGGWGDEEHFELHPSSLDAERTSMSLQAWFQGLLSNLSNPLSSTRSLPLIGTGFFRDYATIYKRLALIPTHTSILSKSKQESAHQSNQDKPYPDLYTTYHAYRPSTPIKKSLLPPPEFYVVVLDARESMFPTATQLSDLLARTPIEESRISAAALATAKTSSKATSSKDKQPVQSSIAAPEPLPEPDTKPNLPPVNRNIYTTLKTGSKSVLLAVVDSGLVSYIRVADGMFAQEKAWMRNPLIVKPASGPGAGSSAGRGGKGAGRGRGRGRGRGKGSA